MVEKMITDLETEIRRELAVIFRKYGIDDSSPLIDGLYAKATVSQHINLEREMQQAKEDCGDNIPVVLHRKFASEWLITMRLTDWIKREQQK